MKISNDFWVVQLQISCTHSFISKRKYEHLGVIVFFFRMHEVKKFVDEVREEERRKQEEAEMEEKRAVAALKIQVYTLIVYLSYQI